MVLAVSSLPDPERSEEHTSELQSQSNLVCRLLLEKKNRPEVHVRFAQNEQETIWDWSLTPILSLEHEDTVRFMLASAIEVKEQPLARQEMEQLNLLKDDFLSLASHELRTPLSSILGNAQLLQRNLQRQMQVTGDSGNADGTAKSDIDQEVQMLERLVH